MHFYVENGHLSIQFLYKRKIGKKIKPCRENLSSQHCFNDNYSLFRSISNETDVPLFIKLSIVNPVPYDCSKRLFTFKIPTPDSSPGFPFNSCSNFSCSIPTPSSLIFILTFARDTSFCIRIVIVPLPCFC